MDSESYKHFKKVFAAALPSSVILVGDEPWHIWNIEYPEVKRILVLSVKLLNSIPGSAYIRICIFDANGYYINSKYFSTGNRRNICSIKLIKKLKYPLIQVNLTYNFNKKIIMRQYYSIVNDRIILEKVEDKKGNVLGPNQASGIDWGER